MNDTNKTQMHNDGTVSLRFSWRNVAVVALREFNSNAHWILSRISAVELDTTIYGTTIFAP